MNTGAFEGLALMLSNFLRIPPGTSVRKYYGGSNNSTNAGNGFAQALAQHDFVSTIVDITSEDVCLTATPFYLENGDAFFNPNLRSDYNELIEAMNCVAKWVAVDLLKLGYSVYRLEKRTIPIYEYVDGVKVQREVIRASFVPVLENLEFFMTAEGEVKTYVEGELVENLLVFLNYSKESLSLTSESSTGTKTDCKFAISPEPIQLKHVASVVRDLNMVERAMYRYRVQLSRIIRFVEVEGGLTQGGENNELIIDNTSAAINANSMSLSLETSDETMMFDDNIPIVPIRKGIGQIDIKSDIPDFSMLKELPDLDYTINKLFLAMRFPKSYSDFTEALNSTAVSLIRGDVRYTRMVDSCRNLMQETFNYWLFGQTYVASEAKYRVKMTQYPSSEDDDVIEALGNYQQFVSETFEFVNSAESKEDARARLDSLVILLGDTANLQSVQKWVIRIREYIDERFKEEEVDKPADASMEGEDIGGREESLDMGGGEAPEIESRGGEDTGEIAGPSQASPESYDLPPTVE